ncbi:MAG: TolC family protein, partial [Rhizobiales bacterium]|nr:TolC family protein [Hyphomicrobiales bacterium]
MIFFPVKCLAPILLLLSGCVVLPDPISLTDRANRVETDLLAIYASQEPVKGRIDFPEAVARALKYNVDKKLQEFEAQISRRSIRSATLDMLPDIVANAGYSGRDKYRSSTSRNLSSNVNSIGASTSEDRERNTGGLTFSWNILDFGVSYFRAKQNADKYLIANERRIKVSQNVIMDVRDAYWRAVAADQVLPQVNIMIDRINAATRKPDTAIESGLAAPLTELKYQRNLLNLMGDLVEVRRNLASSKVKLASLMNLKPGTQFRITGGTNRLRVPRISGNINSLRIAALTNRPELREEDYRGRITKLDTTIQKLKL